MHSVRAASTGTENVLNTSGLWFIKIYASKMVKYCCKTNLNIFFSKKNRHYPYVHLMHTINRQFSNMFQWWTVALTIKAVFYHRSIYRTTQIFLEYCVFNAFILPKWKLSLVISLAFILSSIFINLTIYEFG